MEADGKVRDQVTCNRTFPTSASSSTSSQRRDRKGRGRITEICVKGNVHVTLCDDCEVVTHLAERKPYANAWCHYPDFETPIAPWGAGDDIDDVRHPYLLRRGPAGQGGGDPSARGESSPESSTSWLRSGAGGWRPSPTHTAGCWLFKEVLERERREALEAGLPAE